MAPYLILILSVPNPAGTEDISNLFWFFTFLKEQPFRILVVSDKERDLSIPKGLKGTLQILAYDESTSRADTYDFMVLDISEEQEVTRWLDKADSDNRPAFTVTARRPLSRFLAWPGTGVHRFQIYVNDEVAKSMGYQFRLPRPTAIHLVSALETDRPICHTPGHENCFPW
jgi:hypothetical protein